jgi:hypothetical protein
MGIAETFGSILTWTGILMLLHAGYSAHHHRRLILLMGAAEIVDSPPIDVIIEALLAFLIILIGKLFPIKLIPVRYSKKTNKKKWEASYGTPHFTTLNSRLKGLHRRFLRGKKA